VWRTTAGNRWRQVFGGTAGDARMTGGLELRASVQSLELGRPNLTVSMRQGTARAAHNVAAAAPQGSHRGCIGYSILCQFGPAQFSA
jgi:hypothetical protein